MTDNESYGVRVEKKIDSMQSDIRMLSDHVTRLTFINEAHQNMSAENRKDIDLGFCRCTCNYSGAFVSCVSSVNREFGT